MSPEDEGSVECERLEESRHGNEGVAPLSWTEDGLRKWLWEQVLPTPMTMPPLAPA